MKAGPQPGHRGQLLFIRAPNAALVSATRDVFYGYDLLGQLTSARFDSQAGEGVSAGWDALGRMTATTTTMGGVSRSLSYQYDAAGNRTRVTHPDGIYFDYAYDVLNRMTNATWTIPGTTVPFMAIAYDDLGRRTDISRASGAVKASAPTGRGRVGTGPYLARASLHYRSVTSTRRLR